MNLTKLAFGVVCGGAVAVGAVACGGGDGGTTGSTTGTTTGTTVILPDMEMCNLNADADTGTVTGTVTHLGIPASDGFNLDGLNNAAPPAGSGANVAGCGKTDTAGGVDNALGAIATSLASVIDLNQALQDTLLRTNADGGTSGSITVQVMLDHLNAGQNDPCVGIHASIGLVGNAPIVVTGTGSLTNNVLTAYFSEQLQFNVQLADQIPPASCTPVNDAGMMYCRPGTLSLTVRGARAKVILDANHTQAQPGSLIGGYIFFNDADPAYNVANQTGFQTALNSFASMVGLGTSFTNMAIQAFSGARDLHMEPNGTLSPCTGASTTSTNRNTVSVALGVDSVP